VKCICEDTLMACPLLIELKKYKEESDNRGSIDAKAI
jgi:hypothetical protein